MQPRQVVRRGQLAEPLRIVGEPGGHERNRREQHNLDDVGLAIARRDDPRICNVIEDDRCRSRDETGSTTDPQARQNDRQYRC